MGDDPNFTIAVEVVGKTLCLALLKNYKANKKYNLQQFGGGGGGGIGGGVESGKGSGASSGGTGVTWDDAKDGESKPSTETDVENDVKKSDLDPKTDDGENPEEKKMEDGTGILDPLDNIDASTKDEFGYRKFTEANLASP